MITNFIRAVAVFTACGLGNQAAAQSSFAPVENYEEWTVFLGESPKECVGISAPKETVNTRDGQTVSVRRGDIRLFVFYRPDEGANAQVAFTGGYPFASGSIAEMNIGGAKFQLFTEGEYAWPSPDDDAKIVAAMKRGADATVTARSGRGTQTQDKFSLVGFTAAEEDAKRRCAG